MCGEEIVQCQHCSSGCYCSSDCVNNHRSEHEALCGMIQSLEEIEVAKLYHDLRRMEVGVKEGPAKNQIVSLVGERPLVEVCLDGVSKYGLWDTGSQISMLDMEFVKTHMPNRRIHSVREFLGEKLSISAANNSEVPIEGIVVVDFGIEDVQFPQFYIITSSF